MSPACPAALPAIRVSPRSSPGCALVASPCCPSCSPPPSASPASANADVSGPKIVSYLNAQRAANGIPAGIAENPALSDGCAKHDRCGATNNTLAHGEDCTKPGYTPEATRRGQDVRPVQRQRPVGHPSSSCGAPTTVVGTDGSWLQRNCRATLLT